MMAFTFLLFFFLLFPLCRFSTIRKLWILCFQDTGIVCSLLNEQLPNLSVLFRRPEKLSAFFSDIIARQLNREVADFKFDTSSDDDQPAAFIGLSVKSQKELFYCSSGPRWFIHSGFCHSKQ